MQKGKKLPPTKKTKDKGKKNKGQGKGTRYHEGPGRDDAFGSDV
jgi:hypothetical protein